jgi:hypothetical protein
VNCEDKKVAPSYCLRFKLNCESEGKTKHVCCTYPLPDDEAEVSLVNQAEDARSEKVRLLLPKCKKSDGSNTEVNDPERFPGSGSAKGELVDNRYLIDPWQIFVIMVFHWELKKKRT